VPLLHAIEPVVYRCFKYGLKQGFIKGNPQDIFKGLSQQYQAAIQVDIKSGYSFFVSGDITVYLTSSKKGIPTLRIKNANEIFKIRVT
jgi:hypothetical protein